MYYKYNNISMYYEKHGEKNKKSILILPGWGDSYFNNHKQDSNK